MATQPKISFIVAAKEGGGYSAEAVGFPIRAEGTRIVDLRRAAQSAVRRHFGAERAVTLLVGGPRRGPRPATSQG